MASGIIETGDDKDSFWSFLNGESVAESENQGQEVENNENTHNGFHKSKQQDVTGKRLEYEHQRNEVNSKGSKRTEDDIAKILKRLDDLNRLDELDDSGDESAIDPLYDEKENDNVSFDKILNDREPNKESDTDQRFPAKKEEEVKEMTNGPLENMTFWEKCCQPDVVMANILPAIDNGFNLASAVMMLATLYQAFKIYFFLKNVST